MNKVKYINEINQNQRDKYDDTVKRKNYIIIDKNEMDEHKKMFLKLYREKREKQIKEENLQKENLIKNLELYKIAKKEKRVKIKETDMKIRDKRDEEKRLRCREIGFQLITIYDKYPENTDPPFLDDCYVYHDDLNKVDHKVIHNLILSR